MINPMPRADLTDEEWAQWERVRVYVEAHTITEAIREVGSRIAKSIVARSRSGRGVCLVKLNCVRDAGHPGQCADFDDLPEDATLPHLPGVCRCGEADCPTGTPERTPKPSRRQKKRTRVLARLGVNNDGSAK